MRLGERFSHRPDACSPPESEGSAVLLSRHGASLASKPESFGSGRTFTDMTACPSLDTPITHRVRYALDGCGMTGRLEFRFDDEYNGPQPLDFIPARFRVI